MAKKGMTRPAPDNMPGKRVKKRNNNEQNQVVETKK
ncbi:hypothetical protein JOC70_002435 [Clostridium pascui]|nr:hypothetical protein [Clostridium pascui]